MSNNKVGTTTQIIGERRQITAVFYDIVGSTHWIVDKDPEVFMERQHALHALAREIVARYNGYVPARAGDGAIAYFGYPTPLEEAAHDAVAAALEIVEQNVLLSRNLAEDEALRVRIGVATSLVVIGGSPSDAERRQHEDIVGIAPNLAARLQTIAEPDEVVVSDETHRITKQGFHYRRLGGFDLKGFPHPETAWLAMSRHQHAERFRAFRRPQMPLVGRDSELRRLGEIWASACRGHGRTLLLKGEGGIGKSRLLAELRSSLRDQDTDIRVFQSNPESQAKPLAPVVETLEQALERRTPPDDADVLRFVIGDPDPALRSMAQLPPTTVRKRILKAIEGLIELWANERPQLLIFEDLHWADSLLLEIVEHLAAVIPKHPVMMAVTSRTSMLPNLPTSPELERLDLRALDSVRTTELIDAIWQECPISSDLARRIFERTDGVPLFVEELVDTLRFQEHDIRSESDIEERISKISVVSFQGLISTRLVSLGKARAIAQAASVLGRSFDRGSVLQMLERDMPAGEVYAGLQAICDAGLMDRSLEAGREVFSFKHALVRDAAYQSLLRARRKALHDEVLRLFTSTAHGRSQTSDAEIAYHAEAAGDFAKAADHLIKAGRHASERSALKDARRLLEKANLLLDRLDRASVSAVRQQLELRVIQTLGPLIGMLDGPGTTTARSLFERGVEICEDGEPAERVRWFSIYWGWWFSAADFMQQRHRAATIMANFEGADDQEAKLQALHCSWATYFDAGDHQKVLRAIGRGLALYRKENALEQCARYGGHDAKVCALGQRGLSQWYIGKVESARRSVSESLDWAEELGHLGSLSHGLDIAAMLNCYRADTVDTLKIANSMASLAEREGLKNLEAKALIFGGWAKALQGATDEGYKTLLAGLEIQHSIGTEEDFPIYFEMQATLEGLLGRPEIGVELIEQTILRCEEVGQLAWLGELFRRLAMLRGEAGRPAAEIRAALSKAKAIAKSQSATTILLRILVDHAQVRPEVVTTKAWNEDLRRVCKKMEENHELSLARLRLNALGIDLGKL